jgi:hypothetical protein
MALRAVLVIATLACSATALAQTPTSPSYRMPLETVTHGITTRTWTDVRTYLNSQCGGSFAP